MSGFESFTASPKGRNIIILLDGTGNQYSAANSNLIKLMSVLKVDETQLLYYSSGLGTVLPAGTSTWGRVKQKVAETIDLGLAWNFDAFVCDAYQYLMDYYKAGDKIYLFGFSRGAYTARALAGMIQRVGLLNPGNYNQIPLAYQVYTGPAHVMDENGKESDPAVLYRRIFGRSRLISIEFLGVWDTVSSLGGIDLPQLPFAAGAKSIKFFRQALALDERRARFTPEYWRPDTTQMKLSKQIAKAKRLVEAEPASPEAQTAKQVLPDLQDRLHDEYPDTDVASGLVKTLECWFMGCHSDVGGGNDQNDYPSLSNIPFRWMLREAVRCGLLLDPCGFSLAPSLRLPAHYAGSIDSRVFQQLDHLAQTLQEQSNDGKLELAQRHEIKSIASHITHEDLARIVETVARHDAEAPSNETPDALRPFKESLRWFWWPLELLYLKTRDYSSIGVKKQDQYRFNLGRGRQIVPGQKIHRSVQKRLIYDETSGHGSKDRYLKPAAFPAAGMMSWEAVRRGEGADDAVWQE